MRNALLNKSSKHSDLRILFIDDNQLRYNQFIDLLAAKDYSAQAILLDDLISFEKYLKQRWDLVIFANAYDLDLAQTIAIVQQQAEPSLPILFLTTGTLTAIEQTHLIQQGLYDLIDLSQPEQFYVVLSRALNYSGLLQNEHRLSNELNAAHLRTQSLVRQSRKAIALIEEGIHIQANAEYLALFKIAHQDDVIGLPLLDILQPENVAAFKQFFKRISVQHPERNRIVLQSQHPELINNDPLRLNFLPHGDDTVQLSIDCEQFDTPLFDFEFESLDPQKIDDVDLPDLVQNSPFDTVEWLNQQLKRAPAKLNSIVIFAPLYHFEAIYSHEWRAIPAYFNEIETVIERFLEAVAFQKLDHGAYLAIFQAVSIEALRTELMQLETKISKTFPYVSQSLNLETSLKTGYCLIPSQVEHTESLENYINKALHQALPHKETTQASPKSTPHVQLQRHVVTAPAELNTSFAQQIKNQLEQNTLELRYQQLYDKQDQTLYIYEVSYGHLNNNQWHSLLDHVDLQDAPELMLQLDRYVLEQSVKQLKQFIQQYPSAKLIINLSEFFLALPQLSTLMQQLLSILGSKEQHPIVIQLPFSALNKITPQAQQQLSILHQCGVFISIRNYMPDPQLSSILQKSNVRYLRLNAKFNQDLSVERSALDLQAQIEHAQLPAAIELIMPELNDVNVFANAWNICARYLQGNYFQVKLDRLVDVQDQH